MATGEMPVLKTDRLDLVPITRQLAPRMFNLLNDTRLYEFTGGTPQKDVESLTSLYERWESRTSPNGSESWFNWALQLRERDEIIGHVQATVLPEHADLAWIVGSSWQGKGFATEAAKAVLQWLLQRGVREVRASIHPAHIASIKVAERLGLRQTNDSVGEERIWSHAARNSKSLSVTD